MSDEIPGYDYEDGFNASDDESVILDSESEEYEEELSLIESESKLLELLNQKLQSGEIEDYSYALDTILIKYKRILLFKKFNITDEKDKEKLAKIKDLKKVTDKDYIDDKSIEKIRVYESTYILYDYK